MSGIKRYSLSDREILASEFFWFCELCLSCFLKRSDYFDHMCTEGHERITRSMTTYEHYDEKLRTSLENMYNARLTRLPTRNCPWFDMMDYLLSPAFRESEIGCLVYIFRDILLKY